MNIKKLVSDLWPLHRTLVSDGTVQSLELIVLVRRQSAQRGFLPARFNGPTQCKEMIG